MAEQPAMTQDEVLAFANSIQSPGGGPDYRRRETEKIKRFVAAVAALYEERDALRASAISPRPND